MGGCEQGMGAEGRAHLVCGAGAREKSPYLVSLQSWDPAHSALLLVAWHGMAWMAGGSPGTNEASATSLFVTDPSVPGSAMQNPLVPELW